MVFGSYVRVNFYIWLNSILKEIGEWVYLKLRFMGLLLG